MDDDEDTTKTHDDTATHGKEGRATRVLSVSAQEYARVREREIELGGNQVPRGDYMPGSGYLQEPTAHRPRPPTDDDTSYLLPGRAHVLGTARCVDTDKRLPLADNCPAALLPP